MAASGNTKDRHTSIQATGATAILAQQSLRVVKPPSVCWNRKSISYGSLTYIGQNYQDINHVTNILRKPLFGMNNIIFVESKRRWNFEF